MVKTETLGIGNMKANFAKLRDDMKTRTARAMVVAAGGVIKKKAKEIAQSNGSVKTGAMVKNIAIKREPQAPADTARYNLGVRHGRDLTKKQKSNAKLVVNKVGRIVKQYVDDPYYWRWVELGHRFVPRAQEGDSSFVKTTYTQRLRNGKLVVRTKQAASQGLRNRRRTASSQRAGAKPFLAPALEQGKEEAITAMGDRLQKELDKAGRA